MKNYITLFILLTGFYLQAQPTETLTEEQPKVAEFIRYKGSNYKIIGDSINTIAVNSLTDLGLRSGGVDRITITDANTTVSNPLITTSGLRLTSYTVAELLALTPTIGDVALVTDSADTITYRSIVTTGSGANVAKVFYDGTNWIYH